MPDFRVIDGDRPRSWKFERAVQTFERLAVELVRSLVRQDQNPAPSIQLFLDFVSLAGECDEPPFDIIETALKRLRDRLEQASRREFDAEDLRISEAGMRHVAAILASDEFARARTSKASSDLHKLIESWLLAHEERTRENGHSYLRRLTSDADRRSRARKELDKWRNDRASKQGSETATDAAKRKPRLATAKKRKKPTPPKDIIL